MLRQIIGRLRDEDAYVRRAAVKALGSLGARLDAEMLREIIGRVRDQDANVRWAAVEVLGSRALGSMPRCRAVRLLA